MDDDLNIQITQQQELLDLHRFRLGSYLKQHAIYGEAQAPPYISFGLDEARRDIRRVKQILRQWGVEVQDAPDDERETVSDQATTDALGYAQDAPVRVEHLDPLSGRYFYHEVIRLGRGRVLIAGAPQDHPTAKHIAHELQSVGIEARTLSSELEVAQNVPLAVSNLLDWCEVLLLMWSQPAKDSGWVEEAWTNTVALKKTIILSTLDSIAVPAVLSRRLHLDFRDHQSGLTRLKELITVRSSVPLEIDRMLEVLKGVYDYVPRFAAYQVVLGDQGYGQDVLEQTTGRVTISVPSATMRALIQNTMQQGRAEVELVTEIEDRLGSPGAPNYLWYEHNVKQYPGTARIALELRQGDWHVYGDLPEHDQHLWSGW